MSDFWSCYHFIFGYRCTDSLQGLFKHCRSIIELRAEFQAAETIAESGCKYYCSYFNCHLQSSFHRAKKCRCALSDNGIPKMMLMQGPATALAAQLVQCLSVFPNWIILLLANFNNEAFSLFFLFRNSFLFILG